jgi:hypothetical protein
MRISKTIVLDFLVRCPIEKGGYTGNDIAKIAKNIPVSPQALRKRIHYWTSTDPAFTQLTYIGQRTIPITLDDFILINQRLKEKPLRRMSDILREINDNRQKQGKDPNPPEKPGKICLSRLFKHLDLINKAGKLVREDSEFGKIFASREYVFADGVNARNLLRDLGMLILWNTEQRGYDLDDLIQLVETSNRQKCVVKIVEWGVTRVSEPNVSLVLKSAELILLMAGIVNILNSNESSKWGGLSPVSMENIVLFVPA